MKKSFLSIVVFLFSLTLNAQEWVGVNKNTPSRIQETLVSSSEKEIVVDVEVSGFFQETVRTPQGNQVIISGEDMAAMSIKGAPNLPMYPISMIIGDKAEMKVSVVKSSYVDFENVEIAPSKGNFSRQINPNDVPYTYGDMYQQDAFYPAEPAALGEPYILRDFRGQNMMVYPYAYNPVTKTLRVYTNLRISAKKVGNGGVNQKVNVRNNKTVAPEVDAAYQRRFINYKADNKRYTFLKDEGEMLIVCVTKYVDALKPLVEWKNISGRPTKMVSTAETGTGDELKQYLVNYYKENPKLVYLLLVGEYYNLPSYSISGGGSDNYYGMLEGDDYYEEVFVGRLSVNSAEDAKNQVNKIIYYERDLDENATWLSKASGVAAKEGAGHYNEVDYEHIDFIRDTLLNYTYTEVSQYYANVNNPTSSAMITEYNKGVGLINYCNHGTYDSWAVADFSNADVHKLENDNKLPIVWSVACLNGQILYDECFAEAWMRATNKKTGAPTGAIGGMFSWITQPWIPPMYGQDEMVAILTEWRDGYKHTLGGASCNGNMYVLDMDPFDGPQTHNTWLLFGDPSMIVRTDTPEKMNVTLSQQNIFIGMTSLTLNADADFGIATLSQDGEVIASSYVENGSAQLSFPPLTKEGAVKLVVVGYNKVTEVKEFNVVPADNPYLIYNGNEIHNENGMLNYGENVEFSLNIKNVGLKAVGDVDVKLSTTSGYIVMKQDNAKIENIEANQEIVLDRAFVFDVKPHVPNKQKIDFVVTCTSADETWKTNFFIEACAPVFSLKDIKISSEDEVMPGDTSTLEMTFENKGDAAAYNVLTELFSSSDDIKVINTSVNTEEVAAGESFTVTSDFVVNSSVAIGSVYELICSVNADYASFSSSYELKIGSNVEDFETGDFTALDWKIEGPGKWIIDDTKPYEGSYCAKTDLINNNQYTKMKLKLEVLADGPLSFYVKVSSEEYYDYMAFLVNGLTLQKWAGEIEWEMFTCNLEKGTHNLEWRYIKDSSTSEGEDRAYLDMITFPPVSVVTTIDSVTDLMYVIEDEILTLSWTGTELAEEYIIRRDGEIVATQQEVIFTENAIDEIVTYSVVAKNGNNYSAPTFLAVDPNRKFKENVSEMMSKKVSLYPNPTSGILFVNLEKSFDAVVYNYQGQVVMRSDNNQGQIDMSSMKSGIYFVEIREADNIMIEKVIVK